MLRLLRSLCFLLFLCLTACSGGSGQSAADQAAKDRAAQALAEAHAGIGALPAPDDAGTLLAAEELGKEDFAMIEGEIRCLRDHFGEGSEELARAEAAVLGIWGADPKWVAGVREHVQQEPGKAAVLLRLIELRYAQVCPDGKASEPFLAQLSP